jgi:glycolate oxidase
VKTVLAAFPSVVDASRVVSAAIAAGMTPAAMEMLDEAIIRAINAGTGAGYPEGRARCC